MSGQARGLSALTIGRCILRTGLLYPTVSSSGLRGLLLHDWCKRYHSEKIKPQGLSSIVVSTRLALQIFMRLEIAQHLRKRIFLPLLKSHSRKVDISPALSIEGRREKPCALFESGTLACLHTSGAIERLPTLHRSKDTVMPRGSSGARS